MITAVEMVVPDPSRMAQLLESAPPEFVLDEENEDRQFYSITRKDPRGLWNPLSWLRHARQSIGTLTQQGDRVTIEANTLSFAARHVQKLLKIYGPDLQLHEVRYWSPNGNRRRELISSK